MHFETTSTTSIVNQTSNRTSKLEIAVEVWPVVRLIPYSRNLRKNDHAVARMADSINQFGFKIPILARSSGEVVDGYLRLKAAKKLGMTEVPVILCDEWSEAQVKAFRLMVNRSANWAEFDLKLVALEMGELEALEFDLTLTGFEPVEVDKLLFRELDKKEDEDIPEPPLDPVTQPGDLWVCGKHRVLCGDAISEKAVGLLLGGVQLALMVTDPPYGAEYDPNWRERAGLGSAQQTGSIANDDQVDWTAAYRLFPGPVAYVWHAGIHAPQVACGLEAAGFRVRAQIIWAKQYFVLSCGDYHCKHEPCWYAVRDGQSSNWCGDRTQSTVWDLTNVDPIDSAPGAPAAGHSAQMPVELMRRPILNNSQRGEIVYDPFLGSGTSLVAAERTDRICYGLDLDPRYVDVTVRRWQNLTGKSAVLEDGRSFEQIAAERRSARVEV
jgi:DNA modification methylase